jgi:hypothetical protein
MKVARNNAESHFQAAVVQRERDLPLALKSANLGPGPKLHGQQGSWCLYASLALYLNTNIYQVLTVYHHTQSFVN